MSPWPTWLRDHEEIPINISPKYLVCTFNFSSGGGWLGDLCVRIEWIQFSLSLLIYTFATLLVTLWLAPPPPGGHLLESSTSMSESLTGDYIMNLLELLLTRLITFKFACPCPFLNSTLLREKINLRRCYYYGGIMNPIQSSAATALVNSKVLQKTAMSEVPLSCKCGNSIQCTVKDPN